jgi:xanthine dehydrogenase accessory factor
MREILSTLMERMVAGQPTTYCRLVETRGSTPQKPGAMMLVFPNGDQAGTLGGGCVEAEVKRRAIGALQSRKAQIASFQLDHDYGWDDGLICGGRMQVLLEPLTDSRGVDYFRQLHALVCAGKGSIETIVFADGATDIPVPSSFLYNANHELVACLHAGATLGTPNGEESHDTARQLIARARPLSQRPGPHAEKGVAFLPILPRCRLVIVGGGHVGKAVADLAAQLDFDICLVDDRPEYVSPERFPQVAERVSGPLSQVLSDLQITGDTYVLIVTRGHNHDQDALYHLVNRGARYVGMIGSRRKIKLIFENLLAEGIEPSELRHVHAPVGIDIGSQTVVEIAVSIVAELVAHRNLSGDVPGRPRSVKWDQ